jgi:hypothetical protein
VGGGGVAPAAAAWRQVTRAGWEAPSYGRRLREKLSSLREEEEEEEEKGRFPAPIVFFVSNLLGLLRQGRRRRRRKKGVSCSESLRLLGILGLFLPREEEEERRDFPAL